MTASELLSQIIMPARTSDTGEEVLTMMSVYQIKHIPIVNNEDLLGVLSEDDILSQNINDAIGSYSLSMRRPFVTDRNNIFDMMRIMAEYSLTALPVVDDTEKYVGLVTQEDIIKYFSNSASFTQPGSVIIIEMNRQDYSFAEIARIIEAENAAILGFFIYEHSTPSSIRITIKINKHEIQHILAALRRYDINVEASFTLEEDPSGFQDRYDSFMKYLDI
jgi:acetoin utilization protein AcuB